MTLKQVHLFATDKCNSNCAYCFKENFPGGDSENLMGIAAILANNVKRVVIGGGEPTLVKNLDSVLEVLKSKGVFVDIHTNCSTLTRARLKQLQGFVDKIGIPIDTLDERIQNKLRGSGHVKLIKRVAKDAQDLGFRVVYHTVATNLNIDKIPALYYDFLKNKEFDCWKIYEFNENLARQNNFSSKANQNAKVKRHLHIQELRGPFNHEKGCTDGLLAKFLLTEEKMKKYKDWRIRFVGNQDVKPYFFINSKGDVEFYTWFSKERMKFGNLFKQKFSTILEKFKKLCDDDNLESSADFFDALNDLPIFARLYEGNYTEEEIEMIKPKYHKGVKHLARLWEIRKYGAPMTKS